MTHARTLPVICTILAALGWVAAPASARITPPDPAIALADRAPGAEEAPPPRERVRRDRIEADLRRLPTKRAINADEENLRGLAKAASMIERELEELGYEVHEQEVAWSLPVRGRENPVRTSRNLWVDVRGVESPEEVLIVGAHFDAVPGSPGADDNATGVVAALELARVLRDRPTERTIRIMFYTAEEVGLVGSRRYAYKVAYPAIESGEETFIGMISLDMLGYFTDEPGSQDSPIPDIPGIFKMPDAGDFLGVVAVFKYHDFNAALIEAMERAAPDLKIVSSGMIPEPIPDMRRSDHAPFWDIDIPAVLLTDTSNFRNPHYHTPRDTIETLDLARLTLVVRALAGGVYELAGPIEAARDDASSTPRAVR